MCECVGSRSVVLVVVVVKGPISMNQEPGQQVIVEQVALTYTELRTMPGDTDISFLSHS